MKQREFDINENFITANAYACVEINAHGMINIIQRLRNANQSNLFFPKLFSSQPCEHIFRQMNSMGTVNYTKINFTLFELFHLISRVDLMNEIVFSRLNTETISFPRMRNTFEVSISNYLPSDQEIINVIKEAQRDALKIAAKLGMHMIISYIYKSELAQTSIKLMTEEMFEDLECIDSTDDTVGTPDTGVPSNSIEVRDEDGTTKIVRKSTFVWMLSESKGKLSSDRLKRVQECTRTQDLKRKKLNPENESLLFKSDEIEIGILDVDFILIFDFDSI